MREAIYIALKELMRKYDDIIVIDADVNESTRVSKLLSEFKGRVFNLGIVEQSCFGIAAGLAMEGFKPYVAMFSIFALRSLEIIRQAICYPNLDVKIIGTHYGVNVGEDGATHQCLEDLGCFRSIPNIRIFSPCDRNEAISTIKHSYDINKPCYIRIARQDFGRIHENVPEFKPYNVVASYGNNFTIIATGVMVYESLRAVELLKSQGLRGKLINLCQIKPLDENLTREIESDIVITVEDGNIYAGLFSAICEAFADEYFKIYPIGIKDRYGKSGKPYDVIKHFGLDYKSIARTVQSIVS